ncbi:hypothetical protein DFH09DRAFT_1109254 [Mycena vulgaris]|nr:hypothetical protein DFH09DRAFT_1109254 [Mycena vulgaris]
MNNRITGRSQLRTGVSARPWRKGREARASPPRTLSRSLRYSSWVEAARLGRAVVFSGVSLQTSMNKLVLEGMGCRRRERRPNTRKEMRTEPRPAPTQRTRWEGSPEEKGNGRDHRLGVGTGRHRRREPGGEKTDGMEEGAKGGKGAPAAGVVECMCGTPAQATGTGVWKGWMERGGARRWNPRGKRTVLTAQSEFVAAHQCLKPYARHAGERLADETRDQGASRTELAAFSTILGRKMSYPGVVSYLSLQTGPAYDGTRIPRSIHTWTDKLAQTSYLASPMDGSTRQRLWRTRRSLPWPPVGWAASQKSGYFQSSLSPIFMKSATTTHSSAARARKLSPYATLPPRPSIMTARYGAHVRAASLAGNAPIDNWLATNLKPGWASLDNFSLGSDDALCTLYMTVVKDLLTLPQWIFYTPFWSTAALLSLFLLSPIRSPSSPAPLTREKHTLTHLHPGNMHAAGGRYLGGRGRLICGGLQVSYGWLLVEAAGGAGVTGRRRDEAGCVMRVWTDILDPRVDRTERESTACPHHRQFSQNAVRCELACHSCGKRDGQRDYGGREQRAGRNSLRAMNNLGCMYALKLGLPTVPVFTGVTGAVKPSADEICGTVSNSHPDQDRLDKIRPKRSNNLFFRRRSSCSEGSADGCRYDGPYLSRGSKLTAVPIYGTVGSPNGSGISVAVKALRSTGEIIKALKSTSRSNENRSITGLNWNFERENKDPRRAVVLTFIISSASSERAEEESQKKCYIRENAEPEQLPGPSNHSPARDAEPFVPQQNRGLDISYGRSGRRGKEELVRVLNGPAYLMTMVDSELWSVFKSKAYVETKREL